MPETPDASLSDQPAQTVPPARPQPNTSDSPLPPAAPDPVSLEALHKNRVEAFSDGVFAFAATVLSLDMHLPVGLEHGALNHALATFGPRLLSYVLSFTIIGVYWVAHHLMMHGLRHVDRTLLWLNILFLMPVALLPFSAALLGGYLEERGATLVYGANLAFTSLVLTIFWAYATKEGRLLKPGVSPVLIRSGFQRTIASVGLYLLGMAASFIRPQISVILYAMVPLGYIFLQGIIDRSRRWSPAHVAAMAAAPEAEGHP